MARTALISAALRHLRDSQHLAEVGPTESLDQAFHLVGFAPECARKSAIDDATADKALGHELRDTSDPIFQFLLAWDVDASRYDLSSRTLPTMERHWRPDCRYSATGSAAVAPGRTMVQAMICEAEVYVFCMLADLWADGKIRIEDIS